MPDLDTVIHLPPDLQAEIRPTVNDLKVRILPWVSYNFQKTLKSDVHYENQLYGVWNAFLASVFPLERRFMIIPQAIIRRAITDENEMDEDLGNLSFGSTGAYHESREMPGTEVEKAYPDFLPVKVSLVPGPIREHRALCIVEVKGPREPILRGHRQMLSYMDTLADHPRREQNLLGFLVTGSWVRTYQLRRAADNTWVTQYNIDDDYDLLGPNPRGDPFTSTLCDIARRNWN